MDPEPEVGKQTYRFLVIGRMGDGKSSLCRFLTGNEGIQVSSKIQSCTHKCELYTSSDKINEQRKYQVEVLDTPGLDSEEENMLKIVVEMADIFNKCEYINGILYVVSMSHNRDQTISWFLNFLRLYFTKEQLGRIIIPVLTHYDKIIFEDDEKVMEAKNSRKQAIQKLWNEEGHEQVINFWENHIEWINDANQKPGLKANEDFQKIYWSQLHRLIEKAQQNKLELAENAKSFEKNILKEITEYILKADKKYISTIQQIPSFKFKVTLEELSFWKTLKEMKSNFSKFVVGSVVVMLLKGYAHKNYKSYKKSSEEVEVGLFHEIDQGINKIMNAKFLMEFREWISISTSSVDTQEDLNRVFSAGGKCHVHITLPKETFFGIDTLQLHRLIPESPEPCIILKKTHQNIITFEDQRRFTNENERQYEFRKIKIMRPSNNFIEQALKSIVRSK